jgi:BON domain
MSEQMESDRLIMLKPSVRNLLNKARWPLWALVSGLIVGAWIGGGPDRYGEEDGVVGGLRGASRTMNKGFRYTAATLRDCISFDRSAVRKLGLSQQIETRLWQDKRLVAGEIIVEVDDGGTAILKGIVPDEDHKDRAVALARDTRGVEKVVDELAIRPSSRTIKAAPAPAVPTGVASNSRDVR